MRAITSLFFVLVAAPLASGTAQDGVSADPLGPQMRISAILAPSRRDARAALKRLNAGEDFASLVAAYSTGPGRDAGGDLGYFRPGEMMPELNDIAVALKVGQHSDIIDTEIGLIIIKKTEAVMPPSDANSVLVVGKWVLAALPSLLLIFGILGAQARGVRLAVGSVVVILGVTTLTVFQGGSVRPVTVAPLLVAVGGCFLLYQGRLWARWLLAVLVAFLSVSAVVGYASAAERTGGVTATSLGMLLLIFVPYVAAIVILFASSPVRSVLAHQRGQAVPNREERST